MLNSFARGFVERFKEPSSWAGLGSVISAVAGSTLDPGLLQSLIFIGSGACGVAAFALREKPAS
jgi:hypothetical protein